MPRSLRSCCWPACPGCEAIQPSFPRRFKLPQSRWARAPTALDVVGGSRWLTVLCCRNRSGLEVEGLFNHPTRQKVGLSVTDGVEASNGIPAVVAEDVAFNGRLFANVAGGHSFSQQYWNPMYLIQNDSFPLLKKPRFFQ